MSETPRTDALWADDREIPSSKELTNHARTLERENAALKNAFPFCERHAPRGGIRLGCLECADLKLRRALSRIDFICVGPNAQEVSGYDIFCDENAVVDNVKKIIAENTTLRNAVKVGKRKSAALKHDIEQYVDANTVYLAQIAKMDADMDVMRNTVEAWKREEDAWIATEKELRGQLAEARRDTERIDFIEQLEGNGSNADLVFDWRDYTGKRHADGLRRAIDAARAKEGGNV